MTFHVNEAHRVTSGPLEAMNSTADNGTNGVFTWRRAGLEYRCIVSAGMGWEHVCAQVAVPGRKARKVPSWEQMCWIKSTFWNPEDCVVQFHPPEADYVNDHEFVLHLWRPINLDMPVPPAIMV